MLHKYVIYLLLLSSFAILAFTFDQRWESQFVKISKNGKLEYKPDERGNIIPDFSRVGYYGGDRKIPLVPVVVTVKHSEKENHQDDIQAAIDQLAKKPMDANGFRGTVLLEKGIYKIPGTIVISASGIVLRGAGDSLDRSGTTLISTSKQRIAVVSLTGSGTVKEVPNSRVRITDKYVPVGAFSFNVTSAKGMRKGDRIILLRPGTQKWITDLKMDQIQDRGGTKQWTPKEYDLEFERTIMSVTGNKVSIDNPLVMAIDDQYGGGEIFKYEFGGRITNVAVEHIYFESSYDNDTASNHAEDAIAFNKVENGWVRNVTARYFGFSCVNLGNNSRNISVLDSKCYEHKSVITGGRRYSFNNSGQLNLFMNCHTADGRHDFVTGARVLGPNVFVNCTAIRTHADIGPHHRWSVGTLYDNITTDGEINVQDRGNWGSGHGWAGITQVVWNCKVKRAAIQNPWVSGKNYCIGLIGEKYSGRLPGRRDAEWEGQNKEGLQPKSLYFAQLNARKKF